MHTTDSRITLVPLAGLFLRIGVMGFGGALANISLMEREMVNRRQALPQAQFLEGVALCYLLPGPTAVLLAIYLGSRLRGIRGGLLCGLAFIAPAVCLTLVFSWVYFQYHTLLIVSALLADLGPVAVALILSMLFRSAQTALTSLSRWALALAVGGLLLFPLLPQTWNLIALLLLSGLVGLLFFRKQKTAVGSTSVVALSTLLTFVREATLAFSPGFLVLVPLAFVFVKASLLMFGGGVVAVPLFQQELVQTHHWLTTQQFLDGVAIGQVTPGPITVMATFAGYAVAGFLGALVATVAMYLPSFVLMLGATPLLLRVRQAAVIHGMLEGIMAGALGMMGATVVLLGQPILTNLWQVVLLALCALLLLRWRVPPIYLIGGASILGVLRLALPLN